jgi:hypothetical protein
MTRWASEQAVCRKCHASPSETGYQVAALLGAMVDSLRTGIEGAVAVTDRAEKLGMLVDEPRFQIRSAHEHLVKMRTLSHSSSPDALGEDYRAGSAAARSAAGRPPPRARVRLPPPRIRRRHPPQHRAHRPSWCDPALRPARRQPQLG